ncbi:hypothetical protein BDV29DRAFT_167408 [Aspergillus leporis]|uniref:Uncharacterized protein n=1 Tax=Aspergillus leporis TaxID=41062 RepID=A0A5N5XCS1_9EURO|nr:hypothetical protein BDV29DRAFT_167408 [Aspergillus leporis]
MIQRCSGWSNQPPYNKILRYFAEVLYSVPPLYIVIYGCIVALRGYDLMFPQLPVEY